MVTAIKGCSILSGGKWLRRGYLEYNQGKISYIGQANEWKDGTDRTFEFPENYKCIPGMIDVHIHGVNGSDTMDATPEALRNIARSLPKEGTTSFLATTMTQSHVSIERALKNVTQYFRHQRQGEAEVLGIHLEGPFINKEKAGAQPPEYIIDPDAALFKKWQRLAEGHIKLVTVAPEIKNGPAFIGFLSRHGVVVSIGHSNGTYRDAVNAVKAGATQVTHLYNGMRGMHHREPGILGGALLHRELFTEMIVDGHHIRPEMVDLAYKLKGSDRVILITDSMRAKGLKNGIYDLGGQAVRVQDGLALLESGTIAGSVLKMKDALKNMLAFTGAAVEDVVRMGAVNPARRCGVYKRKGSLEEGKDADILILDENNDLVMTVCRGRTAFRKGDDE